MTLQPEHRQTELLGSLELFAAIDGLDAERDGKTLDERIMSFFERVRSGLRQAMQSESTLHGWRVQSLFESVVVALGDVRLVSNEDSGTCYFDREPAPIKRPDFRIVTSTGEHVLIEVKNVSPRDTAKAATKFRPTELKRLKRYAELTGARLLIAHYWSGANLWTLLDADRVKSMVKLTAAGMANEMSILGDKMIGSEFPIDLVLTAIEPGESVSKKGDEERFRFRVDELHVACAGVRLKRELEANIAWTLMMLGNWPVEQVPELTADGRLEKIVISCAPEMHEPNAEMAIIGSLSSMASTQFNIATLGQSGDVEFLHSNTKPGALGALIPDSYWDDPEHQLKLWGLIHTLD